jgi:putative lipoic acid-binding regulatory protein
MSESNDILRIKDGLIRLGYAIENLQAQDSSQGEYVGLNKSIDWKHTDGNHVYGKGLQWSGDGSTKVFNYQTNPARIFSSEVIDLHRDAHYSIDNAPVLTATSLGSTVRSSNLRQVGILNGLTVNGDINFDSFVFYDSGMSRLGIGTDAANGQLSVASNSAEFVVQPTERSVSIGTYTSSELKIQTDNTDRLKISAEGNIQLGNQGGSDTKINMYGKIGVGITQIDPEVQVDIAGAIKFAGRKFIVSGDMPTQGTYTQGDTIWNSNPTPGNVMGWVCVKTGSPGVWKSFGNISN